MNTNTVNETVIVTAKCPSCKQKKDYTMPINFTPFCDKCLFVPMVISKVNRTIKIRK